MENGHDIWNSVIVQVNRKQ